MRAFFTKLGLLVLQLFGLVARFQMWLVTKVCPLIPGWPIVEGACRKILAPVVALGSFLQRKFPGLRSLEWLLEIDGLRARHPVLLAFALTMVFIRGLQPTDLGHIGTDAIIYPLLGGLSYLNPFLGLVAALAFGAGDIVQKIVWDDVYYSGTKSIGDWIGARVGYLVAYAGLAVMGLAPGMLSRVFSLIVRKILQGVFRREAAAVADGAGDGMRFPPDMPMEERQRIIAAMQAAGGQPTRLNPNATSLGGAANAADSAAMPRASDAAMQPGLGGVSNVDSARGMGEGFGGARGWAVDAPASGAGGTVSSVVRADSWRQAVSAGHPLARDWDMYLASRGAPGADTLERMQIPPHGLQAAIERTGAPPGGWANLCSDTGVPIEPWMNTPGAQPPGGAAQWLASRGIPAGPPVPTAADWLAQTAVDAPAGVRDTTDEEAAAAVAASRRAMARHKAEDLQIRRELDAAREQAQREQIAMQNQWAAQHGGLMPGSVMPGSSMPGSIMPMPNGGPPDVAFVFPELIASLLGAAIGGWGVVKFVAPHSEWPAFYLRPNADVGCYNLEDKILDSTANWSAGTVPGIGPAVTALIPPVGPTGPGAPPTGPAGPGVPGTTPPQTSGDGVLDDPQAELDRVNKQWEAAKQGVDPKDPGYDAFKKQYDDYRDSLKDKISAQDAARAAAEADARAAQEAAASTAAGLSAVIATRDYHQNNANRLRQDLAAATDPRVRDELTRRIESTEANVASANDEIHRATTGEFQRTRTAWDDRQDKIQAEQSRQMAADLKASAEARAAAAKKIEADARRPEWEAEQARLRKEADRMAAQTGLGYVLTRAFTGSVKEVIDTGTDAVKWTGRTLNEGYEFGKKVVHDPKGYAKAALNTTWQAAKDGANYVGETVTEVWRDVKQGRTWEIVKGTAAGSALTVAKVVGTTGQAIYQTVTDPKKMLAAAKDALGGNDFEKSWDPNLSLTDRLKHVGIGVTKLYGTLATAGQAGQLAKQGLNALGKTQIVGNVKVGLKNALGLGDDLARIPKPKFPPRPAKFVPGIDKQISLSPTTNIKPQLKGMTDPGMKHLQVIADKHGARIAVRPSNPYSTQLIKEGALPKPAWQKMKTITDIDTHLGAAADSRGKVGLFKPKLPDEKLYDSKTFAKIKERYESRKKEWKTYAPDFKQMELEGKIKIRGGAIHAPNGKPYAGDYDIFQVTGANGEKLPDAVRDRIIKELQQPPFSAQHPAHLDWVTSNAKEAGMKSSIATSHAATVPAKIENGVVITEAHAGEPLITAIGGETDRAGAAGGRFVGSHFNIPEVAKPDIRGVV
ncbi:MAG: hypothetical protein K8T90_01165 [Planctomycetes bacterium]|nr:hypothetical protein [Planctomycetota bacterium]